MFIMYFAWKFAPARPALASSTIKEIKMTPRIIVRSLSAIAVALCTLPAFAHISTEEHSHANGEIVAGFVIAAIGVALAVGVLKRMRALRGRRADKKEV